MTLDDILTILGHRVTALRNERVLAVSAGQLQQVVQVDADIAETEITMQSIQALLAGQ
jgi:hypothetical protein